MSFVYAKLLVVICIAYVISDAVAHNNPRFYYEGFFTYLYGMSIFFLLYVFYFLLQESSCCSGAEKAPKPAAKSKKMDKEKEKKKEMEKEKAKPKDKEKKEEEKKKKGEEKQTKEKKEKDKKNKKQEKVQTMMTSKKNKNNKGAGADQGIYYQVKLLSLIALEGLSLDDWNLTTEQEIAGKFDDIVFQSGKRHFLMQAKRKANKNLILKESFQTDSKNADFGLRRYFDSFNEIEKHLDIQRVIICTNSVLGSAAEIFDKECLIPDSESSANVIFRKMKNSYKLNDSSNIASLQETEKEQSEKFREKLRLVCISDSELDEAIKECLRDLGKKVDFHISDKSFIDNIKEWLHMKNQIPIVKSFVHYFLLTEQSQIYFENLNNYKMSFQNTPNVCIYKITNVIAERYQLLNILNIHDQIKAKYKIEVVLYIPPNDCVSLGEMIDAFKWPKVKIMFVNVSGLETTEAKKILNSIINVTDMKDYYFKKAVVLSNKALFNDTDLYKVISLKIQFDNLTTDCQDLLLQKYIYFQGRETIIGSLVGNPEDGIGTIIDPETINRFLDGNVIHIGKSITGLEELEYYYIERTLIQKENRREFSEGGFIHMIFESRKKIFLIVDSAGMGKSTILTKLGILVKKEFPNYYQIRINLNECTKILRECKNEGRELTLERILESKSLPNDPFEKNILYTPNRVMLIIDAVDEISPSYTDLVLTFLEQTREMNNIAKIFVTTRPHLEEEMQEKIKSDCFELLPFTTKNLIHFLAEFWKKNLNIDEENKRKKCVKYAKQLLENIGHHLGRSGELLGIPLQTRMIAEIFQESDGTREWLYCKNFITYDKDDLDHLRNKLDIAILYDMFVERKKKIFVDDKCRTEGNVETEELMSKVFEYAVIEYQKFAIELLLRKHWREVFKIYSKPTLSETIMKMGLLHGKDNETAFIHRTFAEYFLARWAFEQLKEVREAYRFLRILIEKLLWFDEFEQFREFLEHIVANEWEFISEANLVSCSKFKSDHLLGPIRSGHLHILKLLMTKRPTENYTHIKEMQPIHIAQIMMRPDDSVNISDRKGTTALHKIIQWNSCTDVIRSFIKRGAEVTAADVSGYTVLHYAVECSSSKNVGILIDSGAEVNAVASDLRTPLHCISSMTQLESLDILIEKRADVNAVDSQGNTPLRLAIENGCAVRIVEYLLKRKAQVNDITTLKNPVLLNDEYYLSFECVRLFIKNGADVNAVDNLRETPLHRSVNFGKPDITKILIDGGAKVNAVDFEGKTPLHQAIRIGKLAITKILIDREAEVNALTYDLSTPLHYINYFTHFDSVQMLIEKGADVNAVNNLRETPLHRSVEVGKPDITKILIHEGAEVNAVTHDLRTPLHYIDVSTDFDSVKMLFENVADVNAVDNLRETPLHRSVKFGKPDITKLCIDRGAKVNAVDSKGETPLHQAIKIGKPAITKILIDRGAEVNAVTNDLRTPLHYIGYYTHLDSVKMLIDKGADVNAVDNLRETPLHRSVKFGKPGITKLLIDRGATLSSDGIQ